MSPPLKDRLKHLPVVYWPLRRARTTLGDLLPPKQLPGVPGRIHANDFMMPARRVEHVPGYVGGGAQISGLIAAHLDTAIPQGARRGMDLGAGHGRVLRHLVRDFPSIAWTAVDIDPSAVRFCRQEFGVTSIRCRRRLTDLQLVDAPYDVVWMGSLVTHLDPTAEDDLWLFLNRNFRRPGLLAFSTLGPGCLSDLDRFTPGGEAQRQRMTQDLTALGRAYLQYPHYRRVQYGITVHDADAIAAHVVDVFGGDVIGLEVRPRGWLEEQDLHVFRIGN